MQDGASDDDNLFLMAYSHAAGSKEEDNRYLKIMFTKYSEQSWDEKGNPIAGQFVLSKQGARKFASEVLAKWLNLNSEEDESYLQQNFDNIWAQNNGKDVGGSAKAVMNFE